MATVCSELTITVADGCGLEWKPVLFVFLSEFFVMFGGVKTLEAANP
jgi:hypothetical protein